MTHGFFKALLFLGAGSVIHAMSDEQDLRKMGGVWKKIPFTYSMMWIGSLALAGVFPFAGYYSKDIILEAAYASGGLGGIAFWLGLAAAFLTAFYSWRLIILAFHGKSRASKEVLSHVHESPKVMTIPLLLLSVGAVFSGFVGAKLFGMVDGSLDFWNGAIVMLGERNILDEAHQVPALVKFSPLIVGALGISLAYVLYLWKPSIPGVLSQKLRYVYQFLLNKWYFDELYNVLFVKPSKVIGSAFYRFIDVAIIDRFGPNGAAWSSSTLGKEVNRLQTGFVYSYALVMILGVVGIIGWFMWKLI
jgi:NADH-quinone oxidoreductase subunit L